MNQFSIPNQLASTLCLLTLSLAALGLVGCPSQQTARKHSRQPKMQSVAGSSKIFALGRFARLFEVGKPTVRQATQVTPMSLSVPAQFRSDQTREAQYHFVFYDAQHAAIKPKSDWQWKILPAQTRVFFRGEAPTRQANDWQLFIRPAASDRSNEAQPNPADTSG